MQLAIDGGAPLRRRPFPDWPQWDEREERALLDVVRSGQWWSIGGTQVEALQREFAAAHEARFGVGVANGSAALEVCLRAAGLEWGDEVITTPYTFIATANACLLVGAIPRFVDVLPGTWNIDPAGIEAAITPRTKAVIPVHIGGEPADMDAIGEIAARHGLLLIEDACQAHGAAWRGRRVGAMGQMGCFSFQASKNVTGGEGGMIVTNDEEWADRCWSVTNVGRLRHGAWYQHTGLASNYRLSEWAAAVLRVQLSRLEEQAQRRAANGAYLAEALAEVPGLEPTRAASGVTRNAYHLFKLFYRPGAFGGRPAGEFAAAMRAEGIPMTVGYPEPLNIQEMIVAQRASIRERLGLPQAPPEECPVCATICAQGLWLPQYTLLGDTADLDDIVAAALKVSRAWGA